MIDKFCNFLVEKIRMQMPDIDDERAEIILYGMQLIIGELPKIFILFAVSFLLGIGGYMIFAYIALIPYRSSSGGFHLKTHIGCIIGTSIFYYGLIFFSKWIVLSLLAKCIVALISFIFGIAMVSLYAPADTENVPIISKKERKRKKILSYITLTLTLLVGILIPDTVMSNILIFGVTLQTAMITKPAYILTNNKYGYANYKESLN